MSTRKEDILARYTEWRGRAPRQVEAVVVEVTATEGSGVIFEDTYHKYGETNMIEEFIVVILLLNSAGNDEFGQVQTV